MNLHEYQGREIFAAYDIPVLRAEVASTPDEVREIAARIGGTVVVKAQVHAGGRGKAGGVKLAENPDQAAEVAKAIFKLKIKGWPVKKVMVAEASEIASEAYFGITLDREARRNVVICSAAGGIDIEEVAAKTPDKIVRHLVNPSTGLTDAEALDIAKRVYSDEKTAQQAAVILSKLAKIAKEKDTSLIEINPLIVDETGKVIALDAKVVIDDNGLFRQPELEKLRDPDSETKWERMAREKGLSYVKLDGDVGCVVNGAGLAMATMDLIKYYGGNPANFLDIGGSSSPGKVLTAMQIILADKNVKSIVFNIFGGITRCDDVARGIVDAVKKGKIEHPIVVRLTGTNEEEGRKILADSDVKVTPAVTMDEVVQQGIRLALQNKIAAAS
ncbi:MAG: succinate--CoA ligase [ADP-forming] subunit beta [Gemmatimonadota bacterium]|nr:MAG: succinate--CoA ligase [ADP-forming] subunit beta [Gemmatimonadota bacterium]